MLALLILFLTQVFIDALVFRYYLKTFASQSDRSWKYVFVTAGLLTPIVLLPMAGAIIDSFARTTGTFLLMGAVAGLLTKLLIIKVRLKTSFPGAFGVILLSMAAGAVLSLAGLLHPLLSLLIVLMALGYEVYKDQSLVRIQAFEEPGHT